MQRRWYLAGIAAAAWTCIAPLHSAITAVWLLSDLEKAPLLITGQVVSIQKIEQAAKESETWGHEVWRMTANIRVLRSFKTGEPFAQDQIQLTFLQFAPNQALLSPPPLPNIEPGETLVLPLKQNDDPAKPWALLDYQGAHLTIPAHAELTESHAGPGTAHAFILRELSNVIAHGTRREMFAMASYLRSQSGATARELLPAVELQVAPNDQVRWLDIATGLITGVGIPRPTFAELRNPEAKIPDWAVIPRTALLKIGDPLEADPPIIQQLLADAPINAWGSAMSLLEFGDHPALIAGLRQALRDDVSGSCYIAWTQAHRGYTAVLDDALPRALRVLSQPDRTVDVQGAAALLRDFGSDQQLQQLAALARKYQTTDRDFYSSLWQFSVDSEHPPRNARVLDVVLSDYEPVKGINGIRICDYASGILARAVGEEFRDVAHARAWLDAHHIPR